MPNIYKDRLQELVGFAASFQNLAAFLDSEQTKQHQANPTLLAELLGKLPMARRVD